MIWHCLGLWLICAVTGSYFMGMSRDISYLPVAMFLRATGALVFLISLLALLMGIYSLAKTVFVGVL